MNDFYFLRNTHTFGIEILFKRIAKRRPIYVLVYIATKKMASFTTNLAGYAILCLFDCVLFFMYIGKLTQ